MSTWRHRTSPSIVVGPTVLHRTFACKPFRKAKSQVRLHGGSFPGSIASLVQCRGAFETQTFKASLTSLQPTSYSFTSSPPPEQSIENFGLGVGLQPRGADQSRWSRCIYSLQGISITLFSARMSCFVYTFLYFPQFFFLYPLQKPHRCFGQIIRFDGVECTILGCVKIFSQFIF